MNFEEWFKTKGKIHTDALDDELIENKRFAKIVWEAAQLKWQPIETAPSDCYVIFYVVNNGVYIGKRVDKGKSFAFKNEAGEVFYPHCWTRLPEPHSAVKPCNQRCSKQSRGQNE